MTQSFLPAVFMRGGSSKGVFFHAKDLPADRAAVDPILLSVLGSPDPYGRQLDGMGGGISSLSKAVLIGPPSHPEADVDYTFAQVAVDRPVVDWKGNCGNLSSAVGPFAVDEGLVRVADGEALVRIHQVNTRKIIHARFPVREGRAEVRGDFAIAGVAGTGARIRLDFLAPGGSQCAALLPTGSPVDVLEIPGFGPLRASLVDAANPAVFVAAADLGLTGAETPDAIEARADLMALLDRIRRLAGVAMGLAATEAAVGLASPRVALVAGPTAARTLDGGVLDPAGHDVTIRMLSMERPHRAVPMTGAMGLAVACRVEGSIPQALARRGARPEEIRVAHPSGTLAVGAEVRRDDTGWQADSAVVFRTARRLMQGQVALPL
ncbi:2-methylaconitate cis-trans isomerase PrpF family protein [Paracraurococcus ruber]|uniref:PrpF family protein n=1 Tax=Paracraurococcus ruber TaxID=77675 RepID=A0ABS1CYS1_9PROT|nr:PrpF domain-containing protein [Paracraurococcus ruber]MBK1659574.1 PrpF family protein [Paracraurococcus ruber]TDG32324.1 PrpF family protein [Paracraurococcus ruber]